MVQIEFSLGKCKNKAGYSAKLRKQRKLDLKKIKESFETVLETPILVMVKVEGVEVVVHGYGELLFKSGPDFALMERIAEKIYQKGLET